MLGKPAMISCCLGLSALVPAVMGAGEPRQPGGFTAEERGWWSFQPLKGVTPPAVDEGKAAILNDIDRFIVARLHQAGLEQAPEATGRERVRRLYYDLHGLPPTEEQVLAHLKDPRPDAWPRLVDDLLASPRYGMRWGQHWLDLVRYAESDGYREDAYRPHAWPYRDYVIRSINEDKPYDRFVREQLAGDEIDPGNPDALIATAFLRHGIYEWNQVDSESQRDIIIKELAGLTGEAFLGLSVGCAECHDHKFDPILQRDYFRFKSFFSPLIWRDDLPLAKEEERQAHAVALAAWEAESAAASAAWDLEKQAVVEKAAKTSLAHFPPAVQAMRAKPDVERTPYEKQVVYLVERRIASEVGRAVDGFKPKSAAWAALKPFEDRKPAPLPPAFVATDVGPVAPPTVMKTRDGESVVEPGFLSLLAPNEVEIAPLTALNSTGRRSALAKWITDPANPLFARVIVNRVWQHHFGIGLSGNASDFGKLGEPPSHPELLDWLAAGFIENGWSFKWLHRQILASATYRQSSVVTASPRANEVDPGNRLLWRFRPQRLDAEQLRDSLLALSGELTPKTGGPAEEGSKPVPSIFTRKQRNSPDEVLTRFDAPCGFQSVARRDATNTALQSLLMVNAEWPMQRARSMAARLMKQHPAAAPAELAERTMLQVLGRPAGNDERSGGADFLKVQQERVEKALPKERPPETTPPLVDGRKWFPDLPGNDEPSLDFRPGTDHEKLRVKSSLLENPEFALEAIVHLDSLQRDASLRTIASRWNGHHATKGWALGVTGEQSKLSPGQLVMQLTGDDFQAALTLEVVASGLKIPPGKPHYIAAVMSSETLPGRTSGGHIRFYAKDLSDPAAVIHEARIPHAIVGGFVNPERALVVGGRDAQGGHLWSGGIHWLVMRNGPLVPAVAISGEGALFDLRGNALASADDNSFRWITPPKVVTANPAKLEALADFFHVLINSNEFLYLP
jgi:hypothetical protein